MKKSFIQKHTRRKSGSLLDVGAGTGAFLHTMKTDGWKVEGIEPDAQAIRRAADTYGLSLQSSEALYGLPAHHFDAVTLWHVLEHVHDLHGYLEQLKKLCKPGGRIFIAVPNYTSFDAGFYGEYWAAYDVPRHLYHFSPASMNTLMQKHHCTIESIHPMWFDSFYVSLLSEKYRSGHTRLPVGIWNGLKSNLRAMNNRRRASSLIYVVIPG